MPPRERASRLRRHLIHAPRLRRVEVAHNKPIIAILCVVQRLELPPAVCNLTPPECRVECDRGDGACRALENVSQVDFDTDTC